MNDSLLFDPFAGKVENVNKVQTLLFSATLPDWVKQVCFYTVISSLCLLDVIFGSVMLFNVYSFQIAARFLKPDKKTADLVGNTKMKASMNVRHIVLPCSSAARSQLIPDIIRCYSR